MLAWPGLAWPDLGRPPALRMACWLAGDRLAGDTRARQAKLLAAAYRRPAIARARARPLARSFCAPAHFRRRRPPHLHLHGRRASVRRPIAARLGPSSRHLGAMNIRPRAEGPQSAGARRPEGGKIMARRFRSRAASVKCHIVRRPTFHWAHQAGARQAWRAATCGRPSGGAHSLAGGVESDRAQIMLSSWPAPMGPLFCSAG